MGSGSKNVSYVSQTQFHGHRFIYTFIIGAVFISRVSVAWAEDSSQATFEKLQPATKSETTVERLPLSTLNLTLTGVLKGGGKNKALISVGGGRDKLFAVGEAVTPTVKLLAVDSFGAVISHNGASERLEFGRKANASNMASADPKVPVPTQPRLFKSGLIVAFIPAEAVQNLGNNRFSIKRSLIDEQLRSGDFFANAKLEPDTRGGFRVTEIVPGSLYDTLGLKDGDTISAINGKPFKSVADLMSLLYEQRDSIKTAQIQVMRDGSLNNFQLDFQ